MPSTGAVVTVSEFAADCKYPDPIQRCLVTAGVRLNCLFINTSYSVPQQNFDVIKHSLTSIPV